uniref:Uncharacterized protein n=1 Tax=Magallana gigas TaxID=29159 RepID=K1QEE4_MAGGI
MPQSSVNLSIKRNVQLVWTRTLIPKPYDEIDEEDPFEQTYNDCIDKEFELRDAKKPNRGFKIWPKRFFAHAQTEQRILPKL